MRRQSPNILRRHSDCVMMKKTIFQEANIWKKYWTRFWIACGLMR